MNKYLLSAALLLLLTFGATSCDLEAMLTLPTPGAAATEAGAEVETVLTLPAELDAETWPETWPDTLPETWPEWPTEANSETADPETKVEDATDTGTPMWDQNKDIIQHVMVDDIKNSYGSFRTNDVITLGEHTDPLLCYGWVALTGDIGSFGYRINGGEPVWGEYFGMTAEATAIELAIHQYGADTAARIQITVDLDEVWGKHNTVELLYRNTTGSMVVLHRFTVDRPELLPFEELSPYRFNIDAEVADNDSASIAGWVGFEEPIAAFGWSVDGSAITWDGFIIQLFEDDPVKYVENGGPFGDRYTIQARLDGLFFGEHEIRYYARLESGMLCELHRQKAVTKDPMTVGNSTYDYDSSETPNLEHIFTFRPAVPNGHVLDHAPYNLGDISQLILAMDGTYEMTVTNLKTASGHAAVILRGNPVPTFGDANYFGHDGNNDASRPETLSVGCAGVYVGIIAQDGLPTLRINVKGIDAEERAVPHIYTVPMTSNDLKVVDDNKALYFYEGARLLATVELSGNDRGYATQAVVHLNDGTVEVLNDVCAASTAASDIGFVARVADLTFDRVTLSGLPE